jgi:hypothetical protein
MGPRLLSREIAATRDPVIPKFRPIGHHDVRRLCRRVLRDCYNCGVNDLENLKSRPWM